MVQRYVADDIFDVWESSTGNYVKYEDYAALQQQFEEYVDERTAELRALRKELALYKDNCQ